MVSAGRSVVYDFDVEDTGMRNLAIVALTDAGRSVTEVAAVFGLTATYVSMLRGRARRHGSAGLVRRRGRPPKLGERQVAQVRRWAGEGRSQAWIAARYGVARSVVSRLLAQVGPIAVQSELGTSRDALVDEAPVQVHAEPVPAEPVQAEPKAVTSVDVAPAGWPFARRPARPGSAPAATPAATPARCCCTPTSTGSAPPASSRR